MMPATLRRRPSTCWYKESSKLLGFKGFLLAADAHRGAHKEYLWVVIMALKSNPSSLLGDRLLQMNWDSSIRQLLMSSMEYPVIWCTV